MAIPSSVIVESSAVSIWVLLAVIAIVLLVGYGLGFATGVVAGRRAGSKPWWYDVAFPSPDEATLGAMRALSDRFALGEIDAAEFQERATALRKVSETAEQRKQRIERETRALG